MLSFLNARNLVDKALLPGDPWRWPVTPEALAAMRGQPKTRRRQLMGQSTTQWNAYTPVVGTDPGRRVAKENPPALLRGMVADYDVQTPREVVDGWIAQIEEPLRPQWVETSLSGKVRLVWVFAQEVPVTGAAHAEEFFAQFSRRVGLSTALPGYDDASERCSQMWTNGGEWRACAPAAVPWSVLFSVAVAAGSSMRRQAAQEVPLELIEQEVQRRWPGRWQGEFKLNSVGVRFWDETADNERGAQVKPDGMLCFTGGAAFMSWSAILGARWLEDQRSQNLAEAAADIYFDGRVYHRLDMHGRWQQVRREDIILQLANAGVSTRREPGEATNDAGRVLSFIQLHNSIDGAAPLIFGKPNKVVECHGRRVLNTSRLHILEPAPGRRGPQDFPFIYSWLRPAFRQVPDQLPFESCMAWVARFYRALREASPALGQVVFLCGPPNCGKTLFAVRLLCPLFGGRMVNPYDYLVGRTSFSDNLFESAYWSINDEESPSETARQVMLSRLKSAVVNPTHEYHAKFAKKMSIYWTGRTCITTNDDAQSVAMLPEITSGTRDKMCFYAFQDSGYLWPVKDEVEKLISQELPFFANWLLEWQPPAEVLEGSRMGVKSYYDPRLLGLSQQQAYSHNAKELVALWTRVGPEWENRETWTGNPTAMFASMDLCDTLKGVLRDWNVPKLSRALRSLALVPGTGITFSIGGNEREFVVHKSVRE